MNKRYAWATEEWSDDYHAYFDSEEECIKDAIEYGAEDEIYIGECSPIDIYSSVDASYVIDSILDNVGCDIDISREAEDELDKRLEKLINDWIEEFKIGSEWFQTVNVRKVGL